jgi:hypothetical protein
MTTLRRLAAIAATALAVIFFVLDATAVSAASQEKALPRSIYIPIHFETCPHLQDSLIYEGDQVAGTLPGTRTYQFTFYPKLERIEPQVAHITVEGQRQDGEPYIARLAVTAFALYSGKERIDLGTMERLEKLVRLRKLDIRRETFELNLRCADSCAKMPRTLVADETAANSTEKPDAGAVERKR